MKYRLEILKRLLQGPSVPIRPAFPLPARSRSRPATEKAQKIWAGIAAEPYMVGWSVRLRRDILDRYELLPPTTNIAGGKHFVAVRWEAVYVIVAYIPLFRSLAQFEDILERMAHCIRSCGPHLVLLARDLNAKSTTWGSLRTESRREVRRCRSAYIISM